MAGIRPLFLAGALLLVLLGQASAQPLVMPSSEALSRFSLSPSTNAPLDREAQSDRANDLVWQAQDIVNSQRRGFFLGFKHSHLRSGSREYFYADGYQWILVRRSSNGPIGPSLLGQAARGASSQSAGRTLILQAVGHVALGRSDGQGSSELLGGPRLVLVSSPRVGVFGEMLVGVLRFPGENFLTLQPGGGVYVPLQGRRFLLNARVGLNTASFGPFRETGIVVGGGLTVPFDVC